MIQFAEGKDTFSLSFTYKESERRDPDKELQLFYFVLRKLNAKKVKFEITSMDSFYEEFLIGDSLVRLESDIYDNDLYSKDKILMLEIKAMIECQITLAA